ncbi:hypothetical protein [Pantoea sp. SM3]|nr:hypothetical protein [Pantoea sp. SM3]
MILAVKIMLSLPPHFGCHTIYCAFDSDFMASDTRDASRRKRI